MCDGVDGRDEPEIEVTKEMIEAGRAVYVWHSVSDPWDGGEALVEEVFIAMLRASKYAPSEE